jgi:thioredoxin reductase
VKNLEFDGNTYALHLDDDEIVLANRVVIAAGIRSFYDIPAELNGIAGPLCSHSADHHALAGFAGRQVLVIGGGASGIGIAGLMSARGAHVTVAARQSRIAYCDPPRPRSLLEKLQAPESGLGTGWRSLACVVAPMVFYQMPQDFRHLVVRKHLGPAPGWTSRDEVERNVSVMLGARISGSAVRGDVAAVTFRMLDGTETTVEAEHVIAATGYQVNMRRLRFIGDGIMEKLALAEHAPVLSRHFETSVPGLFVVGTAAAYSFGPMLRFAYGAGFASRRLTQFLRRSAVRGMVAVKTELAAA